MTLNLFLANFDELELDCLLNQAFLDSVICAYTRLAIQLSYFGILQIVR